MRVVRKVTSGELLTKQATRKKWLYMKNTYILLNVVTAGTGDLSYCGISVCIRESKKSAVCEISHILHFDILKKLLRAIQKKGWNADIQFSSPPWQCASVYSRSHSSTAGAFRLGIVWLLSLQPCSHSEQLRLFTSKRASWDHSTSAIMICWKASKRGWVHRRYTSLTQATETYSLIQVPHFWLMFERKF
jgi:hypothetical protein